MTRPSELVDEIFVDLTADLVRHKGNKRLLDRASGLMSEGVDPPSAWARAKREHGVPISRDQYARFKEYTAMKAPSPLATAPDLPRTPVRQLHHVCGDGALFRVVVEYPVETGTETDTVPLCLRHSLMASREGITKR